MIRAEQEQEIIRYFDAKKSGRGYVAKCPAHDDHSASLVMYSNDDKATILCMAGCHYLDVLSKANIPASLLYFRDQPFQSSAPRNYHAPAPQPKPRPIKTPAPDMQATLRELIERGQQKLCANEDAQAFLTRRGLTERTAAQFHLGFSDGLTLNGVRVPRGLMMPCVIGGRVWYVKIRKIHDIRCPQCSQQTLAPAQKCACGFYYRKITQLAHDPANNMLPDTVSLNLNALYNADSLLNGQTALVCEGEIDCMTLAQELGLPVVTLGSVGSQLDVLIWGVYLMGIQRAIVIKDNDVAGQNLKWAAELFGEKAVDVKLPDGVKDPNDLFVKAKRLYSWAVKTILTPPQQSKFLRHFAEYQQQGATDAGAARLAWHAAILSGRQWTPAELQNMGLREQTDEPVALTLTDSASEPEYPLEQQWPGRNHDYALGVAYAIGNVTRDGLQYLMRPQPMQWTETLFCAWLCETPEHAQNIIRRLRLRTAQAYQVTITKNQHAMLRFERGERMK